MNKMQDLEDLKRKALDLENNFEITRSKVIELIDLLQAAEKNFESERRVSCSMASDLGKIIELCGCDENAIATLAVLDVVLQRNKALEELKALREQKPAVFMQFDKDGEFVTARYNQTGLVFDASANYVPYFKDPVAQSRDSAEPIITDHQGRPMTYWGGKSNANVHTVQPENSDLIAHLPDSAADIVDWSGWKVCDSQPGLKVPSGNDFVESAANSGLGEYFSMTRHLQPEGAAPEQQDDTIGVCLESGHRNWRRKTGEVCTCKKYVPQQSPAPKAQSLIAGLVAEIESNTCLHEESHRGGAIWEICDHCGDKWADDMGGKPEFKWPKIVIKAREFLVKADSAGASNEH